MNRKNVFLIIGVVVIILGIYLSLSLPPTLENNQTEESNSGENSTGQNPTGQENVKDNLEPANQFKDAEFVFYNDDGSISWHLRSSIISNYSGDTDRNMLELSPIEVNARASDVGKGNNSDNMNTRDNRNNGDDWNNIDNRNNGDTENTGSGEVLYQLSADNSLYDIYSGEMEINGPVSIVKDQLKMTAGRLNWQEGTDELSATGGIRIESPSFTMTGSKLQTDMALKHIIIKGNEEEQAYLSWEKGSDSN
ncbi:MAG: hypothetical protein ACLFUI_01215 [Halanaerobiales bacterium]